MLQHNLQVISGLWCQCDSFACYRHAGEICGGHGKCDCGKCLCDEPWTGQACECFNATNSCYHPYKENPKLCEGHGTCKCGLCDCDDTVEGKYTGRYCERCPVSFLCIIVQDFCNVTFQNCTETCDKLKPCVLCQVYHLGPYDKHECFEKCSNFTPIEEDTVQADEQNGIFPCAGYDSEDCRYVFIYKELNETHYEVKTQKERECPAKVLHSF